MKDQNHIDLTLLIAVLILMLFSLGIVYSASASYALAKSGNSEQFLTSHAAKVMIGIVGLFICMRINYQSFRKFTKIAVIGAVVLLLATFFLGGEAKGATRWLRFSIIGFQPSEFAKYALLFHLCTLIAVKGQLMQDLKKGFVPAVVWVGLVTALVMAQPNFSMGAMIFLLSLLMLYVGNVRLKHIALTFAILLPLIIIYMLSAEYRYHRIMDYAAGSAGLFNGPDSIDRFEYQLRQAVIGFGNGGIFGAGPGESKQRDFFLPESYGDFIFSIVGEEYGFLGTAFFMLVFLFIMYRGYRIAKYTEDPFGRYLAIAITSTITFYALINAGVTLGVFPTTGLPMPFVSYGGSSMVLSACAVGVLLNISSHTDLHPRAREIPVVGSVHADTLPERKVY
jgi:cell division protein FtsW